jgi:hypothetical protein
MRADGAVLWVDLTHVAVVPQAGENDVPGPEVFAAVNECPVPSPPIAGSVLYNRVDEVSTLMIDLSDAPDGEVSLCLRVFYVEQTLPRLRKVANRLDVAPLNGEFEHAEFDGEAVLGVPGTDCRSKAGR